MTHTARTRALWIRGAALAALLGGLGIAYTQAPPPLQMEKLAGDLYVIVGSGGNVAVLTTPEGAILVDDKFEQNVPEILDHVRKVTDQPVRYVINTHHHGDHSGGNRALLEKGTEVVAHERAAENVERNKQPGMPRVTFRDEAAIRLGGKLVRARHFGRGHTNGDAVIHFPSHRVLHAGDLFIQGAPFIDYGNGGSGLEWTETLAAAAQLDFDRVIPGHGPVMTKQDMLTWIQSFRTVRERLSKLKREGKSKEEAGPLLLFKDLPGWGNDRLWSRSYPGLYDELK